VIDVAIERVYESSPERFTDLLAESEHAGFRFVRTLVDEWASGRNKFDKPGEALFAAAFEARMVGVCGLSVDPYLKSPRVGRVRRLYVLSAYRRRGVGRRLVQEVVLASRGVFDTLRLRSATAEASRLYAALGFQECAGIADCTHVMEL
jgi:GNAT superfamily N-acetyltransferase